jgi:hypothetical protein
MIRRVNVCHIETVVTLPIVYHCLVLSTDHELIPARNASLAAVHGSARGSNVRYYPT